ncbi:MAG: tripartite tricarboxylate transporter substrate binding protein [Proteobacteria bacterium]|nr:tripartite tricarboxylate transporter substrate binding protein [Pseudomonadota bacterium]
MSNRLHFAVLAATATLAVVAGAQTRDAASYPKASIKVIVSVPPGGGVDTVTRVTAEKLRLKFGQTVVVENRAGQAGNLGAEAVFSAEPDGYTLLASQPAPLTVNALLYKKLNFDPAALEPVAIMTTIPNVLAVRAGFPARTLAEFLAYARANPDKLNYASQGTGTTSHLTAEMFNRVAATRLVHVPYKGTAPAINDLVAGHVDLMFTEMASAIKLHEAGKARILAIATKARSPLLGDVPTFIESGIANFESGTFNAISAPPKTPSDIVRKLNEAIVEGLQSPEVKSRFAAVSMQPETMDPAQAKAFIRADLARWADVIRAANIAPQ